MPKCAYCGSDTILQINGVPICLKCDEEIKHKKKPIQSEPSKKPDDSKKHGTTQEINKC